ncbi:lactose permease [Yersinia pestis]|nr:Lactose permease [Yersinia pestis biovar Medievalis str. Harbin 35]AYX19474.1 lactose permease [Yersinia pestis]EEO76486.1 Lactose permease [Yersinia pestis Nepal516]EEO81187.1 Lactose permease [Yersinia pestis biovar Orientalis str. India 195]EEO83488.1 Lactose permease [Yersinia pestis biovar Orientalis str. PEXU2]QFR85710.1 lactose permease [Yersinia pestis subsp. pestis bv. Medievalis]
MSKANAVQSYLRNNNFWLFGLFFFFYFFRACP